MTNKPTSDKSSPPWVAAARTSAAFLGRFHDSVPQFLQPVTFKVVETAEELLEASHLAYREYLKRNYVKPNEYRLKLSLYHALPTTTVFIAQHRKAGIIGTLTLVEDSPFGLPMEEIYRAEVDQLRQHNFRLAEATSLALNTELFGRGVFTLFHAKKLLLTLRLFRVMFDYLRSCTATDELVACFNPKHQILYEFLQLQPLGGLKAYASANDNPAIARHLNVAQTEMQATTHVAYRLFYGQKPTPTVFANRLKFSEHDLRRVFVELAPVFAAASIHELDLIKRCYPTYDFSAILEGARH